MAKRDMVVDAGSDTEEGLSWGLKEALGVDDLEGGDWGGLRVAEALMAISIAIFATFWVAENLSVTLSGLMDQRDVWDEKYVAKIGNSWANN